MQFRKAKIFHSTQMRKTKPIRSLIVLSFIGMILGESSGIAQNRVERRFTHGTDATGKHLFLLNPATLQPTGLQAGAVLVRGSFDTKYRTERDANLSELNITGKDDVLAAAVATDFGAGLGVGLNYYRTFHEVSTADLNASEPRDEFSATQFYIGRAVIEMSQSLRIGIAVRFLQLENNILGAMFISDQDNTVYRGALFGIGGGFMLQLNQIHFGMAYHPPLKGKTEIYGEEFIITEPGIAEAAGTIEKRPNSFGVAIRRNIYKKDDRFDGTTINDNNQTTIDIFGLDIEDNNIFFKNQIQFGFDREISPKAKLRTSLAIETVEFNYAPGEELTGISEDNETYDFYRASLSYSMTNARFALELGLNYFIKDHKFTRRNGTEVTYSGQGRDLFVIISKSGL